MKALDAECPVCKAPAKERCFGLLRLTHFDRAIYERILREPAFGARLFIEHRWPDMAK